MDDEQTAQIQDSTLDMPAKFLVGIRLREPANARFELIQREGVSRARRSRMI